jgi:anthranilate synthase/aminodeoxychorismate synthase-like glutamine amidotransferase
MILVIDNFDSFTYNLVQYLGELGAKLSVYRNNAVTLTQIRKLKPERVIISPGPCTPREAGISVDLIKTFGGSLPILGVCLGHQSIGAAYGGRVVRAQYLMHGKTSEIRHNGKGLYRGLENPFTATRYHSLIIEKKSLPRCLAVTARTKDGIIMGVQHRKYKVAGVQFHPESIMTRPGKKLLKNFLAW